MQIYILEIFQLSFTAQARDIERLRLGMGREAWDAGLQRERVLEAERVAEEERLARVERERELQGGDRAL